MAHKKSYQFSIGLLTIILSALVLGNFLAPVVSKGAPDEPQITLPPGIAKLAFGAAFNNQTDCDISTPLPEPISYPANTSQIALQVVFNTLGTHSYQANITPDFGVTTISQNCNKYTTCQGQVCQTQFGVTIKRADAQPFLPNTYTFSFSLDNSSPVNVPFVIPDTAPTPTDTPTATPFPTATDTSTTIPTATDTPTSTPTACPTDTAPGADGCGTITPTPTPTMTPTASATVIDTPTITPTNTPYQVSLSIIQFRPLPETPQLNAIDNGDLDGNFTVAWKPAQWAESYTLEEDDDPAFATASIQSTNAATLWAATAKPAGLYYYRVRALNQSGASGWSNVVTVQVSPPTTFYSNIDATVLEGAPTVNFGEVVDMWVGYDRAGCHEDVPDLKIGRSLLRFDLAAIPPHTPISQATVRVRLVNACWRGTGTRAVTAYRVSEPWDEASVTWNSKPARGEAAGAFEIAVDEIGPNEYLFDVTELVRRWVNGVQPNYGLILYGPENIDDQSARFGFATKEWDDDQDEPRLTIAYTTAGRLGATVDQPGRTSFTNCQSTTDGMTLCTLLTPAAKGIGQ